MSTYNWEWSNHACNCNQVNKCISLHDSIHYHDMLHLNGTSNLGRLHFVKEKFTMITSINLHRHVQLTQKFFWTFRPQQSSPSKSQNSLLLISSQNESPIQSSRKQVKSVSIYWKTPHLNKHLHLHMIVAVELSGLWSSEKQVSFV